MNDPKLMGNGEGHTVAIFTDAESRLIREALSTARLQCSEGTAALSRAIQRARIKAEFDAEQKKRKEAKK